MRLLVSGLAVLVMLLFAATTARATPTGNYRPELPPAALGNGCHPLPAGISLEFSYQVRRDDAEDGQRRMLLQYDLIDEQVVRSRLIAAFRAAGLAERPGDELGYLMPGGGEITAALRPYAVDADSIVRGEVILTMPETPAAGRGGVCDKPSSTKRFAAAGRS